MRLCKHDDYRTITKIWEPKYSTDEILISTNDITPDIEHYLIKFKKCNKYPDWFYMSGKMIRRYHTQPNGAGTMYVVPMDKREDFQPVLECEHIIK